MIVAIVTILVTVVRAVEKTRTRGGGPQTGHWVRSARVASKEKRPVRVGGPRGEARASVSITCSLIHRLVVAHRMIR